MFSFQKVVPSLAHDTFSYVLGKTVRYVNKAGREIHQHLIKHVYYDGTPKPRVVKVWQGRWRKRLTRVGRDSRPAPNARPDSPL